MLMLDIETLGLTPGSVIPAIGWCRFDQKRIIDSGLIPVDMKNQPHSIIDPETVKWWLQQDKKAIASTFFPDDVFATVTLPEALTQLAEIVRAEICTIWSNGPVFDMAHLEDAYRRCDIDIPWTHRMPRCYRTLLDLVKVKNPHFNDKGIIEKIPDLTAHNAQHDAIAQAHVVQHALNVLLGPAQ